jgi:hypothetical protein
MACPYFFPVDRLDGGSWAIPPRLPLGDPYTGECHAATAVIQPGETLIREICNVGYGRTRCEHFPDTSGADAVRFNVAEDQGKLIRIQYVFEKEYWPGEHGVLECPDGLPVTDNAVLQKQAAAFLGSYLRRRDG